MVETFRGMAERVEDFRDEIEDEMEAATREGTEVLKKEVEKNIRAEESVARGEAGGLLSDVREDPLRLGNRTRSDTIIRRGVSVPEWAKYLEYGTGSRGKEDTLSGHIQYSNASPPPLGEIEEWVFAKNVQPVEYDSQYELAKAIQVSIGAEGTYPHPFLRPSWRGELGKQNIQNLNEVAFRRAVRHI